MFGMHTHIYYINLEQLGLCDSSCLYDSSMGIYFFGIYIIVKANILPLLIPLNDDTQELVFGMYIYVNLFPFTNRTIGAMRLIFFCMIRQWVDISTDGN